MLARLGRLSSHLEWPDLPADRPTARLTARQRQILDVVYHLGSATAQDVHRQTADPPSYTTVRGLLRILESQGHVRHVVVETTRAYLYSPTLPKSVAKRRAVAQLVHTFCDGSVADAVGMLLESRKLSRAEVKRIAELVEDARRRGRQGRRPR